MAASIHEIARAAECSIATVSRVFNRRPNVRDDVRLRVLKAARRLDYSPKLTARRATVAIITENFESEPLGSYEAMLTAQLVRSLSREGAQVEIIPTAELDVFQDKFFQGAISLLYRPDHLAELSQLCRSSRLPLVSVNCDFAGYPAACSDDRQGIGLAIDHLAERGHREFALIGKSLPTASQENRRNFFSGHLAERGFPPGLILRIPDAEHMIEGVLKLLHHPVTAVIVTHEDYGLAVSYALALAGKRVPDDLSLISYESAGISRFCLPAQTTIRQDFEKLAAGAIELLRTDAGKGQRLLLPYTLIERDSVGVPPQKR